MVNLLIVDDDIPTTEVLRDCLDRDLLEINDIYTAFQADMAKRIFLERSVDIVLCDIEMPRENGLGFLEWVRKTETKHTEFIFLTCYEKFEYALGAMENEASCYLLKPIDVEKITEALLKSVARIRNREKMEEYQKIGQYWEYGRLKIIRNFWYNLSLGYMDSDKGHIESEIRRLGDFWSAESQFTMVFLQIDKQQMFQKDISKEISIFIVENIVSEVLAGQEIMENLITYEDAEDFYLCAFMDAAPDKVQEQLSRQHRFLRQYYGNAGFTVYISERLHFWEIHNCRKEMQEYGKNNISDRGQTLRFSQRKQDKESQETLLEQAEFISHMEKQERRKVLEMVEKVCRNLDEKGEKSIYVMRNLQMEIQQGVHVFLYAEGINASLLFNDENYRNLQNAAVYTVYNMIKWSTYCISRAMDYSNEVRKKATIADRIESYLKQHYTENVTRNEVANYVYLTPEYVGKLFKKEREISIQDYVNMLRIDKAEQMLLSQDYKIIDVAVAVGFQNIPYFTTVFKKYKGVSPKEFVKKNQR